MGTFRCKQGCGTTCYSKNPATRSVFIIKDSASDYMIESIRSVMSFNIEPDPYIQGGRDFVVRLTLRRGEESLADGIEKLASYLANIDSSDIKRLVCSHSWEPINGPEDYEV